MPIPIPYGHKICINHRNVDYSHGMKVPEKCRDFYELCFIISGDRKCINANQVFYLHSGDVGVTDKNLYHCSTSMSKSPYESILIKFTPDLIYPLITSIGNKAFDDFIKYPVYHFSKNDQKIIYDIFNEMCIEFQLDEPASELILQGMLHKLILTMIRTRIMDSIPEIRLKNASLSIMEAIYYIESTYYKDPSLENVASKVSLTPFYFSKLFKESTGVTYSAYLNHVKVQQARVLLINTKLSMDEIAEQCGFSTRNYMCAIFKKITNLTPKEFKKDMQNHTFETMQKIYNI